MWESREKPAKRLLSEVGTRLAYTKLLRQTCWECVKGSLRQELVARAWVEQRLSQPVADESFAATHRSLWLGSRPRTGHREIFLS